MKLHHFKHGMAVISGKFTGKVTQVEPDRIHVRWDSGVTEVMTDEDVQRRDLRPMFP